MRGTGLQLPRSVQQKQEMVPAFQRLKFSGLMTQSALSKAVGEMHDFKPAFV